MINVHAVNVNHRLDESTFEHLMLYIKPERRAKIRRFHSLEDAQRALIADILLRIVICSELGIKNKEIIFDKNEYGKPFLKGNHSFHFNISHAGDWVVCATHSSPVGIDIEQIQPISFDIAKRFFSKNEYIDLMNIDDLQRLSYFYDLWTLKESYIKAAGKGLFIPLNSFAIRINDNDIRIETENEFSDCFFKRYSFESDYKMAVCGRINDFSNDVIVKELNKMCDEMLIM
ncbi:MAG: ACPS domain-containing protein [Xylanivirga thermophila]|jgi:4'-phosphopantetheinyl transferase|uniref:4'-phosphopantetheinyl transferase family protein n=1 Tax=Xylanivirga thermophila TaxID=2496273 RepID=UPI0039F6172D